MLKINKIIKPKLWKWHTTLQYNTNDFTPEIQTPVKPKNVLKNVLIFCAIDCQFCFVTKYLSDKTSVEFYDIVCFCVWQSDASKKKTDEPTEDVKDDDDDKVSQ